MKKNIKSEICKIRKCFHGGKRMAEVQKACADHTRAIIGDGIYSHKTVMKLLSEKETK